MKILIANNLSYHNTNPYFPLLIKAFSEHDDVDLICYGVQLFWAEPFEVDIVHIHQPEALFTYFEPTQEDLLRLRNHIRSWKKYARIVATIHNRYPHYRNTDAFHRLYEVVYSCIDGVIYTGKTSLLEFTETYPKLKELVHSIIPLHGLDTFFENTVSRTKARKALNISQSDQVFLSFGNIRDFEELDYILKGFNLLKVRTKHLLVSAVTTPDSQYFRRFIYKAFMSLHPKVTINFAYVPSEKVQFYLNASDVLIVPRMQILNSSNLILGFEFGKVVVGPNTGVVGEILEETGNPVFTPRNPHSIAKALENALALVEINYGQFNETYAREHWDVNLVARQHISLFRRILSRT